MTEPFDRDGFRADNRVTLANLLADSKKPGNPHGIDLATVNAFAALENYDGPTTEWLFRQIKHDREFTPPQVFRAIANSFRNHIRAIASLADESDRGNVYASMIGLVMMGIQSDIEREGLTGVMTSGTEEEDDFGAEGFAFPPTTTIN